VYGDSEVHAHTHMYSLWRWWWERRCEDKHTHTYARQYACTHSLARIHTHTGTHDEAELSFFNPKHTHARLQGIGSQKLLQSKTRPHIHTLSHTFHRKRRPKTFSAFLPEHIHQRSHTLTCTHTQTLSLSLSLSLCFSLSRFLLSLSPLFCVFLFSEGRVSIEN